MTTHCCAGDLTASYFLVTTRTGREVVQGIVDHQLLDIDSNIQGPGSFCCVSIAGLRRQLVPYQNHVSVIFALNVFHRALIG